MRPTPRRPAPGGRGPSRAPRGPRGCPGGPPGGCGVCARLRAVERRGAATEAGLGEADEDPWADFRGDADFALHFDRAGRRVNLGRARLVVRDEHDAALAADERHDLLALRRVLLFGVL